MKPTLTNILGVRNAILSKYGNSERLRNQSKSLVLQVKAELSGCNSSHTFDAFVPEEKSKLFDIELPQFSNRLNKILEIIDA